MDHTKFRLSDGIASQDNFAEGCQHVIDNADALTVGGNIAYGYIAQFNVY